MDNKRVVIIGGGTFFDVRSHFALAAPAFGNTAKKINLLSYDIFDKFDIDLYLTMMAGNQHWRMKTAEPDDFGRYRETPTGRTIRQSVSLKEPNLRTNDDINVLVDKLIKDDRTKIVFFNVAMCDWNGSIDHDTGEGKYGKRLSTHSEKYPVMTLTPAAKVITKIREKRKDIFLVGFKHTSGSTEDEQYIAALDLCKRASCNLVLANDTKTRNNMIVTPEEARYHVGKERDDILAELCWMAKNRSHLTFTRSTVVAGDPIPWSDERVPHSLRQVVNFCIVEGAYKAFCGSTAGHFACKIDDQTFLTSIRKTNFNDLNKTGLVLVKTDGPDTVLAYGAKPSVGGQSQRIVFHDHAGMDCIVHFHCPLKEKPRDLIPVASQEEFECGSHECGKNTSDHLKQFGNLKCVYLREHGPNIVFNRGVNPAEVIEFIRANFDLNQKTGGFVSLKSRLETKNTLEDAKELL